MSGSGSGERTWTIRPGIQLAVVVDGPKLKDGEVVEVVEASALVAEREARKEQYRTRYEQGWDECEAWALLNASRVWRERAEQAEEALREMAEFVLTLGPHDVPYGVHAAAQRVKLASLSAVPAKAAPQPEEESE